MNKIYEKLLKFILPKNDPSTPYIMKLRSEHHSSKKEFILIQIVTTYKIWQ